MPCRDIVSPTRTLAALAAVTLVTITSGCAPESTLGEQPRSAQAPLVVPGAVIEEGSFVPFTNADCLTLIDHAGTCYGNNPSATYYKYVFPSAPPHPFGPFQLTKDEAVALVLDKSPPPIRYYSFRSYLWQDPATSTVPIAPLGTSLNHTMIAAESGGTGFDEPLVVITAANRTAAERTAEAIVTQLGVDPRWIHVDAIADDDALNLGHDPLQNPQFFMAFRAADAAHAPLEAWRHAVDTGVISARVYRFHFTAGLLADPFPNLPAPRNTCLDEHAPPLGGGSSPEDELDALRASVHAQQINAGATFVGAERFEMTSPSFYQGFECTGLGAAIPSCNGMSPDAVYSTPAKHPLLDDHYWLVVGLNHRNLTGPACASPLYGYNSLAISNGRYDVGIDSLMDDELVGSAFVNAPLAVPPARQDKLYVYRIDRACPAGAGACFDIDSRRPDTCFEPPSAAALDTICPNETVWLMERIYLANDGGHGPDATKIAPPWLLRYKKP